jgi:chromosome segregation ATPase
MSKLVDKERLAKLAQALDARAKAAVTAEKERAEGVEAGLQASIDAINNESTGILAKAKEHVAQEIGKVNGANAALGGRVDALEEADVELQAAIDANKAAIGTLNGGVEVEGSVAKKIADVVAPINAKNNEQDGKITNVEAKVTALEEADEAMEGEIAALKQADTDIKKGVEANKSGVAANKAAIEKLNGGDDVEGSVAKKISDAITPVQGEIDALEGVVGKAAADEQAATGLYKYIDDADAKELAAAKKYADEKIAGLVNGAPEALNTLKELADAIANHQGVYDAYVETVSAELAKKVDKVAGSRLITEAEATAFAAKAEVSAVTEALNEAKGYTDTEVGKVVAKNGEQDKAIAAAKAQADKGVSDAAAVAARATALEEADAAQDTTIAANKAAIEKLNGAASVEGSVAKKIADAVAPINAKNGEQDGRLTALEKVVNAEDGGIGSIVQNIADIQAKNKEQDTAIAAAKAQADKGVADAANVATRATALEAADVEMQAEISGLKNADEAIKKDVAANKAAIGKLNGGVDVEGSVAKKIADALTDYTDTDALKSMLGNVVNSLALSMDGNKLKLKLGGVEGITIHETSLDMATDDDIDEIIAGLDA